MSETVYMCRPCAEGLKAEGKVIMHGSVREKQTCSVCNRRKFVYDCEYVEHDEPNVVSKFCILDTDSGLYVADGYSNTASGMVRNMTFDATQAQTYTSERGAKIAMGRISKAGYANIHNLAVKICLV